MKYKKYIYLGQWCQSESGEVFIVRWKYCDLFFVCAKRCSESKI